MTRDNVDVHVRLRDRLKFKHDARATADDVDKIGDAGDRAARKLGALGVHARKLGAESSKTRVQLGPLSTTLRGGALAVGAMALGVERLAPSLVGLGEGLSTAVTGVGAAGGVGLLAFAQGTTAAGLGLDGLSEALGGSEEAMRKLTPEARALFDLLDEERDTLRDVAQAGLLPGLTAGGQSALRNADVIRRIVAQTSGMLGGLGRDAGDMLGSQAWGRDIGTVGTANVRVLDDLGHGALHLADAFRHVAVEAAPLTEWLAGSARGGALSVEMWAENARASGDMARFFAEARRDLEIIGSIGGHGGRGLVNLFGAQDVDGTDTLRNLDRMMGRFERWSRSPAVQANFGEALVGEAEDALGALATTLAQQLGPAGVKAGELFFKGFMEADPLGKALMGSWLFGKLGGFKAAGKLAGGAAGLGAGGAFGGRGSSPGNPLWVADVSGSLSDAAAGSRLGRVGTLLKRAGQVAAPVAVTAAAYDQAKAYHDANKDRPGRGQPNPYAPTTYTGPFGWAQQAVLGLFGGGGGSMSRPSQANLNPGSDPMRRMPDIVLKIDSEIVTRLTQKTIERRRARN